MASATRDIEHPVQTERRRLRYLFTAKHHGGDPEAATWLPSLDDDVEFSIFNQADRDDLSDDKKRLYGARRDGDGGLGCIGTWGQQIAEFPYARPNEAWHGYPLWPLYDWAPESRQGEDLRPSKVVFLKMEGVGLLTKRERQRLFKGAHV
jgi:hypothetical protein